MKCRNTGCTICYSAYLMFVVLTKLELKWRKRERKVAIGLNVFNEIPVLLMNTMIKPWKNLLYYGEIEKQFLIEDAFFMQYSRNRLIKNHTA